MSEIPQYVPTPDALPEYKGLSYSDALRANFDDNLNANNNFTMKTDAKIDELIEHSSVQCFSMHVIYPQHWPRYCDNVLNQMMIMIKNVSVEHYKSEVYCDLAYIAKYAPAHEQREIAVKMFNYLMEEYKSYNESNGIDTFVGKLIIVGVIVVGIFLTISY